MGNKFTRKMVAILIAAAMILTSGIGVFAATSPQKGSVSGGKTSITRDEKKMTVTWKASKGATSYIVQVGDKTYKNVTGTQKVVTVKPGKSYKVTVTPVYGTEKGTSKVITKRWSRVGKITGVNSGKKKVTISWKKVKGATQYRVLMYKNGKWSVVKTVGSGTRKATIKVSKKGTYKFMVVPVKGDYVGIRSTVKSGKAK